MKKIILWILLVISIIVIIGGSIFFYKRSIAYNKLDKYIAEHKVQKKDIKITYQGWDWAESGSFVRQFELKGDTTKKTYILSTNGQKKGKVDLIIVKQNGEDVTHPKLKKVEQNSGLEKINLKRIYDEGVKENKIDPKSISYERWKKKNQNTFYPNFKKALKDGELPKDLQNYEKWIKVNVYGVMDKKDM